MKKKPSYAWHFVNGDKLRDGSPAAKAGGVEKYSGPLKLCNSGLHFSRNPWDALKYANGETLRLVDVRGEVIEMVGGDKGCSSERRIIAVMDAKNTTELCRYFARMQALSVSHLWAKYEDEIDVVIAWIMTGDESLRASAWESARESAWVSAWGSARESAWDSAWDSARASALASARASARESARKEFNKLVYECFEDFL